MYSPLPTPGYERLRPERYEQVGTEGDREGGGLKGVCGHRPGGYRVAHA